MNPQHLPGFFPSYHLVSENVNCLNVSLRKHLSKWEESNTHLHRCFRGTGPCAQKTKQKQKQNTTLLHVFLFGKFQCTLAYWEFREILHKETYLILLTWTFPNLFDPRHLVREHFILEGKTGLWQMNWYLTYLPRVDWIGQKGLKRYSPSRGNIFHFWMMYCLYQLLPWCPPPPLGMLSQILESWHYYQGLSITAVLGTSLSNRYLDECCWLSSKSLSRTRWPWSSGLNPSCVCISL